MNLKPVLMSFLLLSGSVCLHATPVSFGGTFVTDDQVVLIPFSVASATNVVISTTSFANGSMGFEPVLTVYDGAGNLFLQDATGGTAPANCGLRAIDTASGFCLDGVIQNFFNAGTYTLALTEYDNVPSGPTLADGFPQTGNGNFTGPEFLGTPGSFILFDGEQRTGVWALSINGGMAIAPEPATFALAGAAILGLIASARRKKSIVQ